MLGCGRSLPYEIDRDNTNSNTGIMNYYKSDTCYYINNDNYNLNGCSNNYADSFIKSIVDNWSISLNNDLKEVNGFKSRLLTNEDLENMGHIYHSRTANVIVTKSEYDCLYSNENYWTIGASEDNNNMVNIVSNVDANNGPEFVDKKYAVRPVINLKRCVITNTCE